VSVNVLRIEDHVLHTCTYTQQLSVRLLTDTRTHTQRSSPQSHTRTEPRALEGWLLRAAVETHGQ